MIPYDVGPGDLFRDKSGNVWTCIGVCQEPTVYMHKLVWSGDTTDPDRRDGGISGSMWDGYERIYQEKR